MEKAIGLLKTYKLGIKEKEKEVLPLGMREDLKETVRSIDEAIELCSRFLPKPVVTSCVGCSFEKCEAVSICDDCINYGYYNKIK